MRFILIVVFVAFCLPLFSQAKTQQPPGLNILVSPYTVSPNNSTGYGIGVGLTPREEAGSPGFRVVGDVRFLANLPYDRGSTGDDSDLLVAFGLMTYVYKSYLLGIQLGLASAQGISQLPTPFYGGMFRGYLLSGLFWEVAVAKSSAGNNYTQAAIGFHIL